MSNLVEAHIEEINAIKKNLSEVALKIAFCYPNDYRVGMASLGTQLIYRLWNSYEEVACERSFLPIKDIVVPYTLESDRPLYEMDVIAFTMQYEDDFTNILRILERANIPLESKDRNDKHPLILAGGPSAQSNPVPMAPFIDAFMIGDLEPISDELIYDGLISQKTRSSRMETLNSFPWMWIPEIEYNKKVSFAPKGNLDEYFYPIEQIIQQVEIEDPWHGVFGKSFLLEVVRGCNRKCSFCLTGKINRPKRDRSLEKLIELYKKGTNLCNVSKVTMIGSGISDYNKLEDLCQNILFDGLSFSLPSIRADKITLDLVRLLAEANQKTVTTAPEAGTEEMRKTIGKAITDEEIFSAVENTITGGLTRLKAYFILGLPNETEVDIEGIIELAKKISAKSKGLRKVRFSCGYFIPKPRTKFEDEKINSQKEMKAKGKYLKKEISKISKIDCEIYSAKWASIQTILSIGNEEISPALKTAALFGGSFGDWRKALKEHNLDVKKLTEKREKVDEHPWDFIKLN